MCTSRRKGRMATIRLWKVAGKVVKLSNAKAWKSLRVLSTASLDMLEGRAFLCKWFNQESLYAPNVEKKTYLHMATIEVKHVTSREELKSSCSSNGMGGSWGPAPGSTPGPKEILDVWLRRQMTILDCDFLQGYLGLLRLMNAYTQEIKFCYFYKYNNI